jgi:tetratricopeptide (TPR) repeat protein
LERRFELVPIDGGAGGADQPYRLTGQERRGLGLWGAMTQFVGREDELAVLRDRLAAAGQGHGQLVAVVGEPGVGKSRLFWEFTHSTHMAGWLVLEAGAVPYGKATPYLPAIELLKVYCGIAERDDQRAIREKVIGKLLARDPGFEVALPAFLTLLDLPVDDRPWQALDPAGRRRRTLEALKCLLLRESQVQPLALVFEDLHWIDGETQALLDSLVESLPGARLLVLVSHRSEYAHDWGHQTVYARLRIDPLPRESAEVLLEILLGTDPSLDPLKRLLIERTEGNPLFVEESVRALVETGALTGERGKYRLARDLPAIHVPGTVQAILTARIDRLPREEKRLLEIAAVIGKDFPLALLLAVADEKEGTIRRGLGHLQTAEFLYETRLFPDLEYTFKHALTHEVAYGSLLQERRRALHAQIVGAIERVHADRLGEHIDRLAHHAFRGEVWEKALHYLREIGSTGSKPSIDAYLGGAESPGHLWFRGEYERALALALRERTFSVSFGNFGWAILTNYRLGQIYHSLGDYAKATEALTRNVTQLEGDLRREMFEMAGLPSVLSRVWLAFCLGEAGRFQEAEICTQEATAIAEAENHAYSLVIAHAGTGMLRNLGGQADRAIGPLERGLVIARLSDIPLLVPLVSAPLGRAYALVGRTEEGLRLLEDAIQRAEEMEWAANHALRLVWLAETHLLTGDWNATKRLGARALELARRLGERGHEAYALRLLGQLAGSGPTPDVEQAGEHYLAGLALAKALGMQPLAAALTSSLPSPR